MSSLGWALLEHFVRADAWLRTTSNPALRPLAALLLLALVGALVLVIAAASRRLLQMVLALRVAVEGPRPVSQDVTAPRSNSVLVPSGGRGARAPGRGLRRPLRLAVAR